MVLLGWGGGGFGKKIKNRDFLKNICNSQMKVIDSKPIYIVVKGTTWDISKNVAQLKGHIGKIVAHDINKMHIEAIGLIEPGYISFIIKEDLAIDYEYFKLYYMGEDNYVEALRLD